MISKFMIRIIRNIKLLKVRFKKVTVRNITVLKVKIRKIKLQCDIAA